MDGEQSDFPKRVSLRKMRGEGGGAKQAQSLVRGRTWQFIRRWRDQHYEHAQGSQKNHEFENIVHGVIGFEPRCTPPYDRLHSGAAAEIAVPYAIRNAVQWNFRSRTSSPRKRHPPPAALTRK